MEYYVQVTDECNLRCSYCFQKNVNLKSGKPKTAAEISQGILKDVKKTGDTKNAVVFYGGEPLIKQQFIKEFMQNFSWPETKFILQTNGVLLDSIDPFILDGLDYLLVSFDGEHRLHDQHRSQTFEKILKNIFQIRQTFKGKTMARITLKIPEGSAFRAVLETINLFDSVFWQLENKPKINESQQKNFLEKYERDLDLLVDYWFDHLKAGIMKNIIPFQAITASFLLNEKHYAPRCGCGSFLVHVDLDGQCYPCDELARRKELCLGSIENGINHEKKRFGWPNIKNCWNCEIKFICGGRCLKAHLDFPEETNKFYCQTTKMLVKKVEEKMPDIKKLVEKNINPLEKFKKYHYCEELP